MLTSQAKFLTGDLLHHVVVMAMSASIGLLSMFVVDFVDLYFISLLGDPALTAAVGFAGTLIYFNMSVGIGLMIAMSALAAQKIGRGDSDGARKVATNVFVFGIITGCVGGLFFFLFAHQLMGFIGATGDAQIRGAAYLRIVAPSLPIMVAAMSATGLLRAHGDARRAMNTTLVAGIVNAVLDPILIFGFDLSLEGAAIASVCARIAMAITAIYPIFKIYGGIEPFNLDRFRDDLKPILGIGAPAILTNVATPVGALITLRFIAVYGNDAVAGFSVINRLAPLVFCVIFAISGAVGPIIGQNFGAEEFGRVRETIKKSLIFTVGYAAIAWILLIFSTEIIGAQFNLGTEGMALLNTFALVVTPLFFFNGALFISNAAFNNLDRPTWSTMLNWGKNTIGVLPFVWLGSEWAGAGGVLVGQSIGGIFFAIAGVVLAFKLTRTYELRAGEKS